jgi:isopenicillin N synthase-like dioxygenase
VATCGPAPTASQRANFVAQMALVPLRTPVADLSGPRDALVSAVKQAFSFDNTACPGMLRLKMSPDHAQLLRAVHEESRRFFDMPRSAKDVYSTPPGYPSGPHRCGGYKIQKAFVDPDGGAEHVLNEWFVAGCPRPIDRSVEPEYYDSAAGHHFYADDTPRSWPEEVPTLRPAHDAYYLATEQVCFQLLEVFEEVIGFAPGDLLRRARREPFYVTTVAHYPELEATPPEGQVRIDAHYDQSLFALVGSCDAVNPLGGNLEVRALDGSWSEVGLGLGELVLNCGEQLARLSNGTLHHAVHRVNTPPAEALADTSGGGGRSTSRISVMTYFQLDYDADITPIPQCVPEGSEPKYPPSIAAECILYTDPVVSAKLGFDVEAQKKMRIAQVRRASHPPLHLLLCICICIAPASAAD